MIESLIARLQRPLTTLSIVAATTLGLLVGAMALSSTAALAAAPEEPHTEAPLPIGGTTATFKGELNPGASEAAVKYHFAYSAGSEATCTESGDVAPAEPVEAVGKHKKVSTPVTGLEALTKYTVCLVAANPAEEAEFTVGTPRTFETLASKPLVVEGSENASGVTTSQARLAAVVNPEMQSTECHFEYGIVVTEHSVACSEPSETLEGGEQEVAAIATGLVATSTYQYRVVVKNVTGETKGTTAEFETVRAPSEVETGTANAITTTSAEIEGKLNAGGEATYYIEYGTAPCSGSTCGEQTPAAGPVGGRAQEPITPIPISGLKPDTTYHYWLVATNAAGGPVHGAPAEFKTLLAVPSHFETGEAEALTPTSASLGGELNPGGEATYYIEYGTEPCVEATEATEATEGKEATEATSASCGEKTAEVAVTGSTEGPVRPIAVGGLKPNTLYHYWLVVKNAAVTEPVHGGAHVFSTLQTPAEAEAEAAARRRPTEELAGANAAKQKAEEEAKRQEAATAAVAAATKKRYEEITAVTALSKHQEEALKQREALIAATSVRITKAKLSAGGVQVTVRVTQAGTVTIAASGLKRTVAKLTVGTHTIRVKLNGRGRAARNHHKKMKLDASLNTSLTSVSTSTTIKL